MDTMFTVKAITFETLPSIKLDGVPIANRRRFAWATVTRGNRTENVSFNLNSPLSIIQTASRFFSYITAA
jgi:hypothetical protein